MDNVTQILNAAGDGDSQAACELLSLVYDELRRVAASKMARESPGQTLQPTSLVHEAWLRLTNDEERQWDDSTQFFAAAAEAMRRILVDKTRRRRAVRRGGEFKRVDAPEIVSPLEPDDDRILAVNKALEKLAARDQPKADLVKLRYFVGLTTAEATEVLGTSVPGWRARSGRRSSVPFGRRQPSLECAQLAAAFGEIELARCGRRGSQSSS